MFRLLDSVQPRSEDGISLDGSEGIKGDIAVVKTYFEYPTRPEGECVRACARGPCLASLSSGRVSHYVVRRDEDCAGSLSSKHSLGGEKRL